MKILRITLPVSLAIVLVSVSVESANAQLIIAEVIRATVTKVIKAIDLRVQRMQNKTIWLQNAQKVLENQLAKLKLSEISGWTEQQRQLYSNYYGELWQIKSAISYYQRVKELTSKQVLMVRDYQRGWVAIRGNSSFSGTELTRIQQVYSGMLEASMKNLDQVLLVISNHKTQMSDEERLELINQAGDRLDENYNDLRRFTQQNLSLNIQRKRAAGDNQTLKMLYGIN
ncbi:conjugal transfer protein TraI [Mucilaginibacter ginkgonis]|uniref:Conjugal transfer protein TraI n=1 Tax=Mucilaginibacter ginkgonis TaxID=2682091 RepID=A0A6I4HWS0_9SPHI|nr:conjugal transfer protein TraI [Mucilaginibacter ginkgonis]QQL49966.1 conjugal transfer protein TraI [Mucilaginibacter ginkgonis]